MSDLPPTNLVGCACGRWHVSDRTATFVRDGVVHRYGLPCYREGTSKALGALPEALDELHRLRERVRFLEAALDAHSPPPPVNAWEDAHEPAEPPMAGQDPEAAGFGGGR